MRVIKWLFGLIFLLLLLVVAGIAVFVSNFDANSYKDRIIQTVKNETGRDLTLNGELKTTFYPWLGIELNDAELSNAVGFAAEKFLSVEQASIRLQLVPLLKKNVVADRIQLNGVDVWLARNAEGKTNWQDVQDKFQAAEDAKPSASQAKTGDGLTGSIAGFTLQKANLQWNDALNKQDIAFTVKEFSTGELKAGAETSINTEFAFEIKDPVIQGQVKLYGRTKLSELDNFVFTQPEISIDIQGLDAQAENIHADINVTEISYIDGGVILSNPNILLDIRNMPSLAKQANITIKGTNLSYLNEILSLPKADIKVQLQGSAFPGESMQSALQAENLSYANNTLELEAFNLNGTAKGGALLKQEISGQLAAPSLIFGITNQNMALNKADLKVQLQGGVSPVESLQGSLFAENLSYVDKTFGLENFKLNGTAKGANLPQKEISGQLAAPSLTYGLNSQNMTLQDFAAKVLDLDVKGSVSGQNVIEDSINLSGKINIAEFSPKKLAQKLAIELPEMSNEAWTQASLNSNFAATKNSVALSEMTAFIDGTKWLGKAAITDLKAKKVSFDLSAESLDANRLIPPKQADALQDKRSSAAKDAAINAIAIPQAPLKEWDAKGTLKVGKMTIANIVTTDLEAGINLLDGKLRIFPSKAGFFGGTYSGDLRLDVSGKEPRLQASETVTNIDLAALGDAVWQEQMMTGQTDAHITLDTVGSTIGAMRERVKGNMNFKINNGEMQGFDMNYSLAKATAVIRSQALGDIVDTKKTPFQTLSGSATVNNGILNNEDFLAVMPRMRLRGKGQLNLLSSGLNYQVSADVLESKSATSTQEVHLTLDELVGATIPVKVTGTLFEPIIRPDVAAFLKLKAEKAIQDKLKKEIEDKVGDKLGTVLGGLIGGGKRTGTTQTAPPLDTSKDTTSPETLDQKPTEDTTKPVEEVDPVQQKKDELEQKAKDKLKDIFGGL